MNIIKDYNKHMNYFLKNKYNGTIIFVYNDYNTYPSCEPHIEECYNDYEIQEVYDSFSKIFQKVILCPSEKAFIELIPKLEDKNNIYVYTMAQNVSGYSRRALIPALCEYYGFININADTYSSVIGVNKKTTYNLLVNYKQYLPYTFFIDNNNINKLTLLLRNSSERVIVKPDCESCCIDTKVFNRKHFQEIELYCLELLKKYTFLIIQDFILGEELGVTIIKYNNEYYSLSPVKLEYLNGKDYLTNLDSRYNNFTLTPLEEFSELEKLTIQIAKELGFSGVSRFDYKLDKNNNYYLFDISPNPTITGGSSCNLAFKKKFNSDNEGIYQFLAISAILFKPSFNSTKH